LSKLEIAKLQNKKISTF